MKKILLVGIALAALSSLFFLQCEKTETLAEAGEISFKSLSDKVWYLEKMNFQGKEVIFSDPITFEFSKGNIQVKTNTGVVCQAALNYPADRQFSVNTIFDCINDKSKLDPRLVELLSAMQGVFNFKMNENQMVFSTEGLIVSLSDKLPTTSLAMKFEGTAWEVKELMTKPKDISIQWTSDFPKLIFKKDQLLMQLPKNNCTKAYQDGKTSIVLDELFNCSTNPCCVNQNNSKLAELLVGEFTFKWAEGPKGTIILINKDEVQIIMTQVPFPDVNTDVVPGPVE